MKSINQQYTRWVVRLFGGQADKSDAERGARRRYHLVLGGKWIQIESQSPKKNEL